MALEKEKKTIESMIHLYCKEHHKPDGEICAPCNELLQYAFLRLDKCPYGVEKPACSKCETHCYKPHMRDEVRKVMRWAGPRMLLHHPVLAVDHLIKTVK